LPRFEFRGDARVEPPSLDIGADVFVSIDGERVAIMQFGESCTFDVKPGPHEIRAHNTLFWKTHHVVLRPGEHASALPDLRARERRRRY